MLLCVTAGATASAVIVPDDFPTIQAAVDSGANLIQVRPGTYPESVLIQGHNTVAIEGLGGRPLLAPPDGDGFRFKGPRDALFSDFELRDVDIVGGRRAVFAKADGITVQDVTATGSGRGIDVTADIVGVRGTTVTGTTAGTGFRVVGVGPSVIGCVARNNDKSGFIIRDTGRPGNNGTSDIRMNVAEDNGGEGLNFRLRYNAGNVTDNGAARNGKTGIRIVQRSEFGGAFLNLLTNTANDNGLYGFWVRGSKQQYTTTQDVIDDANVASGNAAADYRVD